MNMIGTCLLLLVVCFAAVLACPTSYDEVKDERYECMESFSFEQRKKRLIENTDWCWYFTNVHACISSTMEKCKDTAYFQENMEELQRSMAEFEAVMESMSGCANDK